MIKKIISVAFICSILCSGCSKPLENIPSAALDLEAVQCPPRAFFEELEERVPSVAPDLPQLDRSISYLEISPEKDLTVYISRDKEHPQIVLCRNESYYSYDWNYDLSYGEPMIFIEDNPINTDKKWVFKELVIFLPTAELTAPLSPIGAREICGEEHILDYDELTYEVSAERNRPTSTAAYCRKEDGREVLSLMNSEGKVFMEFPELNLPYQDAYEIVCEDAIHCTETGMRYQRVGILSDNNIVWIGKYCGSKYGGRTLFADAEIGYRVQNERGIADGPYDFDWQLRPLEPDALLDLDGDGISEKISYRFVLGEGSHSQDFRVFVNGVEHELGFHSELNMTLYTACLDGKSAQIIALNYGVGRDWDLAVFQYKNSSLHLAGYFFGGKYEKIKDTDENIYVSTGFCHPLQRDFFEQKQKFSDGILSEITQDYYEFRIPFPVFAEDTQRNIITTKREIDLYFEKDGTKTFSLPPGSHVVFLGSDFKKWILVENTETGEQGWLRVEMEDKSASCCILADGSEVERGLLFEGLIDYD